MQTFWIVLLVGILALWFTSQSSSAAAGSADDPDTEDDGNDGSSLGGGVQGIITALAAAIQRAEGWFPGSVSFRNKNPGNIETDGDLGTDSVGHGIFSTLAAGEAKLVADLTAKFNEYPGATLAQILNRYSLGTPVGDTAASNAVTSYVQNVATFLSQTLGIVVTGATSVADLIKAGA